MRCEGTLIQRRKEKIAPSLRRQREKGERRGLWLLFLYVSLALGLSYVNWAGQECCLFYLRFSLQSSDLPLFYFQAFPSRSFTHHHSVLFFAILNTYQDQGQRLSEVPGHPPQQFGRGPGRRDRAPVPGESEVYMPDVRFRAPRPPFQKTSILDERVDGCVARPPAEHSGKTLCLLPHHGGPGGPG